MIRVGLATYGDNGVDFNICPDVENPQGLEEQTGYTHETVTAILMKRVADYLEEDIEIVQIKNDINSVIQDYNLDVLNVSYSIIKAITSERAIDLIPCQVVASAGNFAEDGESPIARFNNVISVGAVDKNGNHLDFSSYGKGQLDYVAIGRHEVNGRRRQGTSFASPVFAVLYAYISKRTDNVIEVINELVVDVDEYGEDLKTGLGWLRMEDVKKWGDNLGKYPMDIKDHWAENIIKKYIDKGIVKGYPDGTFRPDETVTRAELLAILNRL